MEHGIAADAVTGNAVLRSDRWTRRHVQVVLPMEPN
jgi:hypothetical protein